MATATRRGLACRDGGELLGRDHVPLCLGMPRLAAPSASAGRRGRLPLEPRGVGRWRPGGVGRVLIESGFEVGDSLLQPADHGGEAGLSLGSERVPDDLRDRFRSGHDAVIKRSGPRLNSPGRERLQLRAKQLRRPGPGPRGTPLPGPGICHHVWEFPPLPDPLAEASTPRGPGRALPFLGRAGFPPILHSPLADPGRLRGPAPRTVPGRDPARLRGYGPSSQVSPVRLRSNRPAFVPTAAHLLPRRERVPGRLLRRDPLPERRPLPDRGGRPGDHPPRYQPLGRLSCDQATPRGSSLAPAPLSRPAHPLAHPGCLQTPLLPTQSGFPVARLRPAGSGQFLGQGARLPCPLPPRD